MNEYRGSGHSALPGKVPCIQFTILKGGLSMGKREIFLTVKVIVKGAAVFAAVIGLIGLWGMVIK